MSKILEDWLREGEKSRDIVIRFDKEKDEFSVTLFQYGGAIRTASAFTIEGAMRFVQYEDKDTEVK